MSLLRLWLWLLPLRSHQAGRDGDLDARGLVRVRRATELEHAARDGRAAVDARRRELEPAQPLAVQRKALLALSALLRSGGEGAATVLALDGTMSTLVRAAGSDDAKLRRRGLFLLLVLVREGASFGAEARGAGGREGGRRI